MNIQLLKLTTLETLHPLGPSKIENKLMKDLIMHSNGIAIKRTVIEARIKREKNYAYVYTISSTKTRLYSPVRPKLEYCIQA